MGSREIRLHWVVEKEDLEPGRQDWEQARRIGRQGERNER